MPALGRALAAALLGAAIPAALLAAPAWAGPGGPTVNSPLLKLPPIRSYQPYSGLQYGFRPEPPGERGIRPQAGEERPEVVMPTPVPPLIEYGAKSPLSSQYYRYCPKGSPCR